MKEVMKKNLNTQNKGNNGENPQFGYGYSVTVE